MSRDILRKLEEKVDPKHAAVVCIDMQNDFCEPEGGSAKEGRDISMIRKMVPNLISFIERARDLSIPIIFVRNIYSTKDGRYLSDVWLEQRLRHKDKRFTEIPVCAEGSWDWEFVKGIEPRPDEPIVTKHRYSAFIDTDLDLVLRSKGIKTMIMTGVTTNCCVESTARDGFMKDYYIVFVRDCVAAFSERTHNATLENIDRLFGQVVTASEVLASAEKVARSNKKKIATANLSSV